MKISLLLADYVQGAPGQKVHGIGIGWSQVGTPLPPHGLLFLLEAEPEELGQTAELQAWLVDDDGQTVTDPNENPIALQVEVTSTQPQNDAGAPTLAPITVNFNGGMPLEPGLYRWKAELSPTGCTAERAFRVREKDSPIVETAPA